MADPLKPADLSRVRTHPLSDRPAKVGVEQFARPGGTGASVREFLAGLSDLLAVRRLRGLAAAVVRARNAGRPVIWALGGHVIKTGQAPVLIRLMRRGMISGLVLNGAAAIHDWEIAVVGSTSEDVPANLDRGTFGLAEETGAEFSAAAREASERGEGYGPALARRMLDRELPYREHSILAAAAELSVPTTVHVAIGSDVVHQHPSADGAAIGEATFTDFRRLVTLVSGLSGGVWINVGSAVQLPEVFLKALSVAGNLGHGVDDLTTADLDMIPSYRTEENVLRRPTRNSGQSFRLIGHHELNLPLLAAAIEVASESSGGPPRE